MDRQQGKNTVVRNSAWTDGMVQPVMNTATGQVHNGMVQEPRYEMVQQKIKSNRARTQWNGAAAQIWNGTAENRKRTQWKQQSMDRMEWYSNPDMEW